MCGDVILGGIFNTNKITYYTLKLTVLLRQSVKNELRILFHYTLNYLEQFNYSEVYEQNSV